MIDNLVYEEECPCFMGGSCPTDYKHKGISPRLAIYDIVKAVELGDITRYQANEFIIDVLMNIPPERDNYDETE